MTLECCSMKKAGFLRGTVVKNPLAKVRDATDVGSNSGSGRSHGVGNDNPLQYRADWGSDLELLMAKFRLKLKKVGKTTRPFRCGVNQIPYNYTVGVTNRFKGIDLIDREPDKLWSEVRDTVQEAGIKTTPKGKKCKKAKWLCEEGLQIAVNRREAKGREKE